MGRRDSRLCDVSQRRGQCDGRAQMLPAKLALIFEVTLDLRGKLGLQHAERVQFVQFAHLRVCHCPLLPVITLRSRANADRVLLFTVPSGS